MPAFDRNALFVYISYSLQAVGLAISWQFVTYFVRNDLGAEDFLTLTLVWSTPALITMVVVNFWGSLSDRIRRRKPFMIIGFLGYAGSFLAYSFVRNSFEYFIVAIIGSIFYSAALPMAQAVLTTNTEKKGERLGFLLVFQSAGFFCGAVFSGFYYEILTMFVLFRFAAVLCIGAAVFCVVFVKDVPFEVEENVQETSFRTIMRKPGMTRLAAAVASSQIGINSIAFMFAIMLIEELHGQPAYVGLANGGATAIAVIITGYVGILVDKQGPSRILMLAFTSYAIFAVGFALVTDPIIAAIMWALPIYPLSSTAAYGLGAVVSDEAERGRAMSLISGAQNAGSAFGPILGGFFAEYIFFRVQPLSWINYLFNVLALLLIGSVLKTVRKKEVMMGEIEPPIILEEPLHHQ